MKNKGFTIAELIISITLLSLVLIFMLALLVNLREKEKYSSENLDILLEQAITSKRINSDFFKKEYVIDANCEYNICDVTFNDGSTKNLSFIDGNSTLVYKEGEKTIFAKKLPDNYSYDTITLTEASYDNGNFYKIVISILNHPEYNIEVYSYYLR